MEWLVDPQVSRAKFSREVEAFRALEDDYLKRGWWILRVQFPEVFVVFATPQLSPPAVVFGAILDFTNYDLWPPSVTLVDPLTRVPFKANESPSGLLRALGTTTTPQGQTRLEVTSLLQAHGDEEKPFLCLPGVREYHQHPAHTGDSWLIHRGRGEGTLLHLLDVLFRYGAQPIDNYRVRLKSELVTDAVGQLQVHFEHQVLGFSESKVPK